VKELDWMARPNFEMGALLLYHTKQIASPPKESGKANRFPEFGVGVLLFVFFKTPHSPTLTKLLKTCHAYNTWWLQR